MYGITFDLTVAETESRHPHGLAQAYSEIDDVLLAQGFRRMQLSLYVIDSEDMAKLFQAIQALRTLAWFPKSVRDIRAFRIEPLSDFTAVVKS